jgi:hypothetical protein
MHDEESRLVRMIRKELLDSDRTAGAGASTVPGEFLEEDAPLGSRRQRGEEEQRKEGFHRCLPEKEGMPVPTRGICRISLES